MVEVESNVQNTIFYVGRKMVQVKIICIQRQINQSSPIGIHHAKDNFCGRDFKACRLDNIVKKFGKDLENVCVRRLTSKKIF
jgi:hypothetical protein